MRSIALALLTAVTPLAAQAGRVVTDSVRSPALEGNRLGDPTVRALRVYLPPSYDSSDTRYPVLYLLHGFGGSPSSWSDGTYRGLVLEQAMDSVVAQGGREFVIAMVDGHNAYGGSVFANSALTGNWETYLIRDVVRHVDGRYRTLRRASSRGIAGHSMGAASALRIAMRFPGLFGLVYAMSANAALPCQAPSIATRQQLSALTGPAGASRLGFEGQLCLGYSAAWSPDTTRAPMFVAYPFAAQGDGMDSAVVERWNSWKLLDMAPRYREGLVRLRAIGLDVGTEDGYYTGQAQLDSLLTRLRVRHTFEAYPGDHNNRIAARVTGYLLPFFSEHFDYGPIES